jgi:hypothetical protein
LVEHIVVEVKSEEVNHYSSNQGPVLWLLIYMSQNNHFTFCELNQ